MPEKITFDINTPSGVKTTTATIPGIGEIFFFGPTTVAVRDKDGIRHISAPRFLRSRGKSFQGTAQGEAAAVAKELGLSPADLKEYEPALIRDALGEDQTYAGEIDGTGINLNDYNTAREFGFAPEQIDAADFSQTERDYTPEERAEIFERQPQVQPGTRDVQIGDETLTGTIPGYKGVYADVADKNLNPNAVNHLFTQYHGRDATQDELDYWTNKRVGDLEDTLAKTVIFEGGDADKIRAEMAKQGLTYISGQAELEELARAGKVSPATIQQIGEEGGMLFRPTQPTNTGTGTQAGTGTVDTGTTQTGTNTGVGSSGTGPADPTDALVDQIADAVGDPNASEKDILDAVDNLKKNNLDPYYQQLISQIQGDVVQTINRQYEDRIRQLQSESYQLAENIANTQKELESRGMTFSGDAIKKLGTLSSFAQARPEAITPEQLQPTPTMTPEQMGIEGVVPMANRLISETSRTRFNRNLEDIRKQAERTLGTAGIESLGLPGQSQSTQPIVGDVQRQYTGDLQNLYQGLANQEQTRTGYQQLFL